MKILLQCQGVDVNVTDDHGNTPLDVAAREGHRAVARKLIKACRLDLKNKDGSTPVELADKINILKLSSCYELQNVNNQIL